MEWYLKVLKNYANFNGRARRKEFWMFILINFLISTGLQIILGMISPELMLIVVGLYSLGVLIPSIAVGVRRLHDINKSGWWYFIGLVPLIGGIWLLVLFATEGTSGENEYGHDPKGASDGKTEDTEVLDA